MEEKSNMTSDPDPELELAEIELDQLIAEDREVASELRSEAASIAEGDLDVASINRRHDLVGNLKKMLTKYEELGKSDKEMEPIKRLVTQIEVVGTLKPLEDPALLVDFSRKHRDPAAAEKARARRDRAVRLKLERNKKYTYLDPSKLLEPLRSRMPKGRKHYADAFHSVLIEFAMRRPLAKWSVWLTGTMVSIYKLRAADYDYEFLQKIVDLMEGTFGMENAPPAVETAPPVSEQGIVPETEGDEEWPLSTNS